MKIDARISLLLGDDGLRIEIRDKKSFEVFFVGRMTPEQTCSAFGRHAACEMASSEVFGLDRVGKKLITKTQEFEMPEGVFADKETAKAISIVKVQGTQWVSDARFSSQDSFFCRDGKPWARTTIRTWVDEG